MHTGRKWMTVIGLVIVMIDLVIVMVDLVLVRLLPESTWLSCLVDKLFRDKIAL